MAFLGIAPTGTVLPFAGSAAPEGWALCDGSAISRTTYSKLFGVISTTYGVGDNSSTFNVPDMRGVYPRGAGTNGTANYGGVTGHTPAGGALAAKGGQKTAKNGLTASANSSNISALTLNSSSITLTMNSSSVSGSVSVGNSTVPTDGIMRPTGSTNSGAKTVIDDRWSDGNFYNWGATTLPSSSHNHSATPSLTAAAQTLSTGTAAAQTLSSGTASAQTITVGAGDTETTPAFLALNYIIKL